MESRRIREHHPFDRLDLDACHGNQPCLELIDCCCDPDCTYNDRDALFSCACKDTIHCSEADDILSRLNSNPYYLDRVKCCSTPGRDLWSYYLWPNDDCAYGWTDKEAQQAVLESYGCAS